MTWKITARSIWLTVPGPQHCSSKDGMWLTDKLCNLFAFEQFLHGASLYTLVFFMYKKPTRMLQAKENLFLKEKGTNSKFKWQQDANHFSLITFCFVYYISFPTQHIVLTTMKTLSFLQCLWGVDILLFWLLIWMLP